jgi:hypothetical protein
MSDDNFSGFVRSGKSHGVSVSGIKRGVDELNGKLDKMEKRN